MKKMNHSWGTIQRPVTDRRRGASLLPYTPASVMGSDDDDDEFKVLVDKHIIIFYA